MKYLGIFITQLVILGSSCSICAQDTLSHAKPFNFERPCFGLGYATCFESGLSGSSKGKEIIRNIGRIEGFFSFSVNYKYLKLTEFVRGSINEGSFPSKYKNGADSVVANDSKFSIFSGNLNVKWTGLNLRSFNIQPLAGIYMPWYKANIGGLVKSTGERFSYLDETYHLIEPLVGINVAIPLIPFHPKGKKMVLGFEPEYNYCFGGQNLHIIKSRISLSFSKREGRSNLFQVFLAFEHEESRNLRVQHWAFGLGDRLPW